RPVERVDLRVLLDRARHAHAAGDAQAVGMIRHARARPAALDARVDDRLERLRAVAVDGMHLEIAAILRARRRALARDDLLDRRAAEILTPQVVQPRNLLLFPRFLHRALDKRAVPLED